MAINIKIFLEKYQVQRSGLVPRTLCKRPRPARHRISVKRQVSERRVSPEDREKFRDAKDVEVKNFILPEHLRPHRDQTVGMRWILTWKVKEDGSVKPKARAVFLGYQDPCYEHRATTAPVDVIARSKSALAADER